MKRIEEIVALPDAESRPLVHPLDLPEARGRFVTSWWTSLLASPALVFAMAATLLAVSNNYVTPLLIPILIAVCAALASRYALSESWAFIPRRRQDTHRRPPVRWMLGRALISGAVVAVGVVLLVGWIVANDVPAPVSAYSVGSMGGIVILMTITLLWNLVAPVNRRSREDNAWTALASLVMVGAGLTYAHLVLSAEAGALWTVRDMVIGAAVIIAIQVVWLLTQHLPSRSRAARAERHATP